MSLRILLAAIASIMMCASANANFVFTNSGSYPVYASFVYEDESSLPSHDAKVWTQPLDIPARSTRSITLKGEPTSRILYFFKSWQQRNNFQHAIHTATIFRGIQQSLREGASGSYAGGLSQAIEGAIKMATGMEPPPQVVGSTRISRNYPDLIDYMRVTFLTEYTFTGAEPEWDASRDGAWADTRAHEKSACSDATKRQLFHVRCEYHGGDQSIRCPNRTSGVFGDYSVHRQWRLNNAWMAVEINCGGAQWAVNRAHHKSCYNSAGPHSPRYRYFHIRCEFANGNPSTSCPDYTNPMFTGIGNSARKVTLPVLARKRLNREWMEVAVACQ